MLSSTVGALLELTISYFSVAAAVPKMGGRHVTTSCSANNTMVKVREANSAHTHTHTHAHTHTCA